MLFFDSNKRRVDEDLEKIRKANLSAEELRKEEDEREKYKTAVEEIGFSDIIAMIIAAFSIIIPYALVFIVFLILFALGFQLLT